MIATATATATKTTPAAASCHRDEGADVRWITVREAAEILGVSHNTLRRMIREGDLPVLGVFGIRRRALVLDRGVVEALARRRREAHHA